MSDTPARHQHLLVAVDGSASADLAVQAAAALAERDGAQVTVLAVSPDVQGSALGGAAIAFASVDTAKLQEDADHEAEEHAARAAAAFPGGTKVDTLVRRGHPAPEIVEEAGSNGYDLLLLGARGVGKLAGLLGSVSQHVLHHADVDVYVAHVRPAKAT